MACDAVSVETLLVATDQYYQLSQRQGLEWLTQLVTTVAGLTVTQAITLAATNKMAALSDRQLEECRLAAFTAALQTAQGLVTEIATQKYPSLDRHDLMCAVIAAYCAGAGGSAQTVETLSVGDGYFKLCEREDDVLALDAVICSANSVNCTTVFATALNVGITGMSERHLKEIICACISSSAGPTCAVPTGVAATTQVDGTVVVTWNAVPAGIDYTEVWSSSDNVTFALAAQVASPATTATLLATSFVKVRFCMGTLPPANANTTTWLANITGNGGAAPSNQTQLAIDALFNAMDACGITSKILAFCMFVPDSLTAARTPLINNNQAGGGYNNPWGNTNFTAADLGINGLTGNGSNKYLDPGFLPAFAGPAFTATNASCFLYLYTINSSVLGTDISVSDGSNSDGISINLNFAGLQVVNDWLGTGCRINTTHKGNGFYLQSRIANNNNQLYFANSSNAWASFASNNNASSPLATAGFVVYAFNNNGTVSQYSNATLSCIGLASGLTTTEGQCLYNAIQACRVALGGGFR